MCVHSPLSFVFFFLIRKFVFSNCFVFGYSVFYLFGCSGSYLRHVGSLLGLSDLLFWHVDSLAGAHGFSSVMCGLSSCGMWA